jgi:hypothetical protein
MEMLACLVLAGYLAHCVADIFDSTKAIRQRKGEVPNAFEITLTAIFVVAYIAVVVEFADEAIAVTEGAIGDLNIWKWMGLFVVFGLCGQIIRSIGIAVVTASHAPR